MSGWCVHKFHGREEWHGMSNAFRLASLVAEVTEAYKAIVAPGMWQLLFLETQKMPGTSVEYVDGKAVLNVALAGRHITILADRRIKSDEVELHDNGPGIIGCDM